jgi:hypothetical protein
MEGMGGFKGRRRYKNRTKLSGAAVGGYAKVLELSDFQS